MPTMLRKFGNEGEDIAAEYLQKKGHRIITRNWKYKKIGEIDIIALAPKTSFWRREQRRLVFVEVKARRSGEFGPPELAVHKEKQATFVRTALLYLHMNHLEHWPHQCDVIAIEFNVDGTPRITHFENAIESNR